MRRLLHQVFAQAQGFLLLRVLLKLIGNLRSSCSWRGKAPGSDNTGPCIVSSRTYNKLLGIPTPSIDNTRHLLLYSSGSSLVCEPCQVFLLKGDELQCEIHTSSQFRCCYCCSQPLIGMNASKDNSLQHNYIHNMLEK